MTVGEERSPSLIQVLRAVIEQRLADVHVSLPCKVESYDSSLQKVEVKPLIKRLIQTSDGDDLVEELPVISDVPVLFPRSNKTFITFPIASGDFGRLVFIERSLDNFIKTDGADNEPPDFRMHDLTDAVFEPGLYPDQSALSSASEDDLVIGHEDGGELHIKNSHEVNIDFNTTIVNSDDTTVNASNAAVISGGSNVNLESALVNLGSSAPADALSLASIVDANFLVISTYLLALETVFKTAAWTPIPGDGGLALKAAYAAVPVPAPPVPVGSATVKADP